MIGYVIFGALIGLTGGGIHLAAGGSIFGALAVHSGLGTLSILALAVHMSLTSNEVENRRGHREAQSAQGGRVRAGRPSSTQFLSAKRQLGSLTQLNPSKAARTRS